MNTIKQRIVRELVVHFSNIYDVSAYFFLISYSGTDIHMYLYNDFPICFPFFSYSLV